MSTQSAITSAFDARFFANLYSPTIQKPKPPAVRWFVYRKEQTATPRLYFIGSFVSRQVAKDTAIELQANERVKVPRWLRRYRSTFHIGPAPLGTSPLEFFLRLHPADVTTEVF